MEGFVKVYWLALQPRVIIEKHSSVKYNDETGQQG